MCAAIPNTQKKYILLLTSRVEHPSRLLFSKMKNVPEIINKQIIENLVHATVLIDSFTCFNRLFATVANKSTIPTNQDATSRNNKQDIANSILKQKINVSDIGLTQVVLSFPN